MVEYTVVLGVITLAIVTTYGLLSGAIQSTFDTVRGLLS
jgi:Flp/Fap pilin component.